MTYIGMRQAATAQWMALRPIIEVCAGYNLYEGVGLRREAWWLQEETEKKLQATLAGISWEASRRRLLGDSVTH